MEERINQPKRITCMLDGELGFTAELMPGASTESVTAPEKHGYTFSGWLQMPVVMPEENITVHGFYRPNRHKARFLIDGELLLEEEIEYGTPLSAPEVPEREGYDFSGFSPLPEAMEDEDLTATGSYIPRVYRLVYQLDGATCFPEDIPCGEAITAIPMPQKDHHTFSGWQGLPEVMPPHDVTVEGFFTRQTFHLTFVINGEVIRQEPTPFGTKLTYPEEPVREGYRFLGWKNVPDVMPPKDTIVSGMLEPEVYRVEFRVDDTAIFSKSLPFGSEFPKVDPPVREGYTFSGWDGDYAAVPAEDVVISGTLEKNIYHLTYTVENETTFVLDVPFGDPLDLLPPPEKEGYTFSGWSEMPSSMPAYDVEVTGSFTRIPKPEPEQPMDAEATAEPAETGAEKAPESVDDVPSPVQDVAYIRNYSYMTGVSPEECYNGKPPIVNKLLGAQKISATVHVSDEEILCVVGPDPKKRGNYSELRFSIPTGGCVKEGRIVNSEAFLGLIKTFWNEHSLPKKNVSLLIDTPNFREKVLTVAPMSAAKTREFVSTQFLPSERLPAPLFDFHVLSENKAARTRQIYAVMADRNDVGLYRDTFRAAGIQIVAFDPALLSALRCIGGLLTGKTGIAQYVSGYSLLTVLFINGIYAYSVRSVLPENATARIWGKEAYTSALQVLKYAFAQGVREPMKEILIGSMHPTEGSVCKNGIADAYREFIADPDVAAALEGREDVQPRFCSFVYPVSGSF